MNNFQRVFGSGPLGTVISIGLLAGAAWLAPRSGLAPFGLPLSLRVSLLTTASVIAVLLITWSVRSLSVEHRGRRLCTSGPFRWIRHPLYAAFLTVFNPALALYLDHVVYLLWALLLHPLWHWVIVPEENLMQRRFGDEYRRYCDQTGRFVPRPRGL